MAYYPVTGSKIYVSNGFAAAKTISGMTNASPPVATSTAHGYIDNDEVLITSGWEDFNGAVFRINQLTADTFSLDGYDATDTDFYPAGSGAGTAEKVSSWLEIGQVLQVQNQGGDVRNITVTPIEKRNAINIPVGFNASSLNFTLGYDPALAAQIALLAASRVLGKRAFKFVLPGGGYAYCYGTVAMSAVPTFDTQSVMQRAVSVGIEGLFTSY